MTTTEVKAAPEPMVNDEIKNPKAGNFSTLEGMIKSQHRKAYKVDIKELWSSENATAWRVNVYDADDSIVRKITLDTSYFVKLQGDKFVFDPPLGKKS